MTMPVILRQRSDRRMWPERARAGSFASLGMTAVLLGVAACAPRISTHASPSGNKLLATLRTVIDSMVDAPEFANANWGILIVDPEWGDTLYARNAGKLFMPASNEKLLTSATALTQLGADFRYRTTFFGARNPGDTAAIADLFVAGR